MEVLEVEPLRMISPKESASNSVDVSDPDSPKVSAFPGNSANQLPPGNSANQLPPGWTVVKKIKSSGSAYKVYIDPVTGMKFYSRRRVLDYLQNQTRHRPPNIRIPAETTPGQHVDWLPADWAVEIKRKMSGRSAGSRYKVYVEKSTGKKFYSQRQALDYLMPSRSSSPEIENVQAKTTPGQHVDWLPTDWAVEIKMKMSGRSAGSRYKVYVEKSTGKKFYSQRQALDYLMPSRSSFPEIENVQDWSVQTEDECGGSDSTAKRKNKVTNTDREEQNVEELPPGWFKATRYRESRAGTRTKIASKPSAEERELKPEERKGKRPLFTEETYGGNSEDDKIEIEDSDEENVPKPKEKIEIRSLFSEERCDMKSEDVIETDDLPIGAEETSTNENEKEKMPATPSLRKTKIKVLASKERPFLRCSESTSLKPLTSTNENERSPLRGTRSKVLASKARPFLRCSISTSLEPLTSNPSNVCPMQTNLRSNGEKNPGPKPKMQIPEEGSSHQVTSEVIKSEKTKASPSLLGQSSLDACLEFAFKTLTEDILVFDKK